MQKLNNLLQIAMLLKNELNSICGGHLINMVFATIWRSVFLLNNSEQII